jgi:hypothetical protein
MFPEKLPFPEIETFHPTTFFSFIFSIDFPTRIRFPQHFPFRLPRGQEANI